MGRPRKPIAAKVLEGTYTVRRDGPLGSHVPAGGEPTPPDWLQGEALDFWREVVPSLVARGIARACDGPYLAGMCDWWALWRRSRRTLVEDGLNFHEIAKIVATCAMAWGQFDKAAARFGLTPADRAKLRAETAPVAGVEARKRA